MVQEAKHLQDISAVRGYDGWKHIEPAAKEQTLHLIGLLSDGGVHSRLDQLLLTINRVRPLLSVDRGQLQSTHTGCLGL